MKKIIVTFIGTVVSMSAFAAGTDHAAQPVHRHAAEMPAAVSTYPAGDEYQAAMSRMHADMSAGYTGNADVDFARGMIPHHQAAVEMAETELKYGKDPVLRKMSEAIIKAQKSEIQTLQNWLAVHDKTETKATR